MSRHHQGVGPAPYTAATTALIIALIFLSLGASQSQAQLRTQSDLDTRQKALRSMSKTPEGRSRKPEDEQPEQPLNYEQSREDFELLQVISGRLPKLTSSGPGLQHSYEQIGKDAAEIRKRATRLRIYFSFEEPKGDEKPKKSSAEFSPAELKSAIKTLDDLVRSFVQNPVFEQPGVLEVEHWGKARRDLEWVINLSEQIQKSAEALSKALGKNP